VDGGLVANLPAAAARSLDPGHRDRRGREFRGREILGPPQSAIGVLFQSIMVVQRTVSTHEGRNADIVIRPKVGHIRWDEMSRAAELIAAGEEAARDALAGIESLLAPPVEAHRHGYNAAPPPDCASRRRERDRSARTRPRTRAKTANTAVAALNESFPDSPLAPRSFAGCIEKRRSSFDNLRPSPRNLRSNSKLFAKQA
jgi:hypothetical protein